MSEQLNQIFKNLRYFNFKKKKNFRKCLINMHIYIYIYIYIFFFFFFFFFSLILKILIDLIVS